MLAGRIMPGTFVAGVDLSGLTVTTATAQVGGAVGDAAVRSATVTFADNAYTLAAGDAAVSVDVSATIRVAYLRGRDSVGAFCSVR